MINAFRVFTATVLVLISTVFLWAQTATTPDYASWQDVAARSTEAIEAGRASDVALGELRSQLVEWRDKFDKARDTNAKAIEVVNSQLAALGKAPEDGEEPAEIATQRSSLNASLSALRAPVQSAEVAYTEADALINGIDEIIRDRQSDRLVQRGPSPLNPAHWPEAFEHFVTSAHATWNESVVAWKNPIQQAEMRANAPEVIFLLAVAFLLLARSRAWFDRLSQKIQVRSSSVGHWLAGLAVSLGQVLLPLVGLQALILAAYATDLPGLRGELFLSNLIWAGFQFLASIWLAAQIFPKTVKIEPLIKLSDDQRAAGRVYSSVLGAVLALQVLLAAIAEHDRWSDATAAVIYLPVFVVACFALWRLAQLLKQRETDDTASPTDRLISLLARALNAVAVFGVALAIVGYFNASQRIIFPAITTLQVLAAVVILQRVVMLVFALVTGAADNGRDSLIPVLMGGMLAIASLPVLALVWGARASDLAELWRTMSDGVQFGETRLSPMDFFTFLLIFIVGYTMTRLAQGALKNTILPKTKLDLGGQNAIVAGLGYIGIFLAALIAINAAGVDLSSIALVAGALSVGIGFGLQNVVSNFVSGIILLIERPVSEGDWIEVNGNMGYVRDISVRSTRMETFDRTDVIIPNADLVSGVVTNYTRGNTIGRLIVPVGVAYGTDPRRVEKILKEIAASHQTIMSYPEPAVLFRGFGASSLDFEIRAILRDINLMMVVHSDLNHSIAQRFMDEGIEIPFAQTDIWLRNPETLRPNAQPETPVGPPVTPETAPKDDKKDDAE
ncbi:DUF3772 domain-containing protein [Cognatishimia maritima]|uniref:Small-conductance mechanosensitive channel n=1 Tax=Cognatishimia maritima TaxID=870908 RepID=A0A1M5IJT1_9RHOB|nr:DUF3772 domain-containing protein [Cognatishimia maritima]SHG28531.1 Small-conductance mechanosensitive channel [Cognatishimia maritima]